MVATISSVRHTHPRRRPPSISTPPTLDFDAAAASPRAAVRGHPRRTVTHSALPRDHEMSVTKDGEFESLLEYGTILPDEDVDEENAAIAWRSWYPTYRAWACIAPDAPFPGLPPHPPNTPPSRPPPPATARPAKAAPVARPVRAAAPAAPMRGCVCQKCKRPLQAVGFARKNGKRHPDWPWRRYHKKCLRRLASALLT